MKTFLKFTVIVLFSLVPALGLAQAPVPSGSASPSTITDDSTVVTFGRTGTCANGFAWSEATLWLLSGYEVLGNAYVNPYGQVLHDVSGGSPGIPYMIQGPGTYQIQYRLVDTLYNYTDQWINVTVNNYSVPAFADSTNLPAWSYDAQTFWNDTSVQPNNNCYNYATNNRTDTFAQPGRAHSYYPYSITAANVATGVAYDGLPSSDPSDGSAKIAMLIDTGYPDYHFVRRDVDPTYWSHKPGGGSATNVDASTNPITNPPTANWNSGVLNYSFSQYFYTPSEVIQGRGHANIY